MVQKYKSPLEEKLEKAKKNKPILTKDQSGQLVQKTPQSIGQAMDLQAPGGTAPVTPVGVSQLGMGPDSAKMAGTPAQKTSALREPTEPEDTLATAQRQQGARQQVTDTEQGKLEKSQNLQNLGSLGDKVQNLIQGQFSALTPPEPSALSGEVPEGIQAALTSGDPAQIQQAITDFANEKIRAGEEFNTAELINMFPNPAEAIGAIVASGMADQLVVDDTLLQSLGYESIDDLALQTGLELPPGSTLQDLQNIVEQEVEQEFQETNRLRGVMGDPAASPAERAAARQALVDSGAIGLSAAEQQAHEIEQQVAQADEIQFGGETHKLEDLLKDEYVSGLTKRFFEDPAFADKIREENPEFAGFLDQNKENLASMTKDLEAGTEEVTQAHEEQQKLKEIEGVGELSNDLIEDLFDVDLSMYGQDTSAITNSPLYQALTDAKASPEDRANLLSQVQDISRLSPEFAKTLVGLDKNTLRQLGAFSPDGGLVGMWKKSQFDGAPPDLAYAFEGIDSAQDLFDAKDKLEDYRISTAFGVKPGKYNNLERELYEKHADIFADGKIEPKEILDMPIGDLLNFAQASAPGEGMNVIQQELQTQSERELGRLGDPLADFTLPSPPSGDQLTLPLNQRIFNSEINSQVDNLKSRIQTLQGLSSKYRGMGTDQILDQIQELNRTIRDLEGRRVAITPTVQTPYRGSRG